MPFYFEWEKKEAPRQAEKFRDAHSRCRVAFRVASRVALGKTPIL